MFRLFETEILPSRTSKNDASLLPRITWGIFLCLLLTGLLITIGVPTSLVFVLSSLVAILLAWQYPYIGFYLFIATAPLIGVVISISTGRLELGQRTFGGSIDVVLAEVVAAVVLAAWALRLFFSWHRQDRGWKPWLPFIGSYASLVGAHIISAFSAAIPDPLLVIKYSLRPVLFVYICSVVMPVNFIRSRQRLMTVFLIVAIVGSVFALDGFRSLFAWNGGPEFLYRARPLSILGFSPIGDNHNVLAELLVVAFPLAIAWGVMTKNVIAQRWATYASLGMILVALFTFARSAWITLACQFIFLGATIWRGWFIERKKSLWKIGLVSLPLVIYMAVLSLSPGVQSSTDTRATLTGIAVQLFKDHPFVGVGAGTFVDHVSHTWIYVVEFGTALDSHGIFQKVLAETGLLGTLALLAVIIAITRSFYKTWLALRRGSDEWYIFTLCISASLGGWIYQVFNTTYWTPKLWLPIGLTLAAGRIFLARQAARDPDFLSTTPHV